MMETAVVLLSLNCGNVISHAVGACAIITAYQTSSQKHLFLYLLNFSVCQVVFNFIGVFRRAAALLVAPTPDATDFLQQADKYTLVAAHAGVFIIIHLNILYISIDRLAKILLNFRYVLHWNSTKVSLLLMITWCMITCFCVVIATITTCHYFDWQILCFGYIYPSLQVSLICISCFTFACIMVEHKRNRRNKLHLNAIEMSIMRRLFLVPSLLVLSFILFVALPDIIYHFIASAKKRKKKSSQEMNILGILYAVQGLVSVFMYMIFSPDLRKLCVSWFACSISFASSRVVVEEYKECCSRSATATPRVAFVLPETKQEEVVEYTPRGDKPRIRIMMVSQV